MGGKIIPRIRLTSAKDLVEVEAELGNINYYNKTTPKQLGCDLIVISLVLYFVDIFTC